MKGVALDNPPSENEVTKLVVITVTDPNTPCRGVHVPVSTDHGRPNRLVADVSETSDYFLREITVTLRWLIDLIKGRHDIDCPSTGPF